MIRGIITLKTRMGKYTNREVEFNDEGHLNNYINLMNKVGAKVIGFHPIPEAHIIEFPWADVEISDQGRVLNVIPKKGVDAGPMTLKNMEQIRFFNIEELRFWLKNVKGKEPSFRINSNAIGFWTKGYRYIKPKMNYREKVYA